MNKIFNELYNQRLTTLIKAINATGLDEFLKDNIPITLFAPANFAFNNFNDKSMIKDIKKLKIILENHIVLQKILIGDNKNRKLKTVRGNYINLAEGENPKINNIPILKPNISFDNGIIHIIIDLLIPKKKAIKSIRS